MSNRFVRARLTYHKQRIISVLMLVFLALFSCNASLANNNTTADNSETKLRAAWEPWYPYEYLKVQSLQSSLTGLDVELLKLFSTEAKMPLTFQELSWNETLQALKAGTVDLASGASYSDERAEYLYYSKPYRFEENSLFVLRSKEPNYPFETAEAFIEYMKKNNFRLGVKSGSIYVDPIINQFIQDPANAHLISSAEDDYDNLMKLIDNQIDGFLADRIVGSTLVWKQEKDEIISEHYLKMKSSPIHLVFSKKTVTENIVQSFDQAIDNMKHKTEYSSDFAWYVYPVIMLQTTGKTWFKTLDVLGSIFFAISGVLIAYSLNQTLLAAFVYGILPSMTGSILRDVIFNRRPVESLETPNLLLICGATVLIGYLWILAFNKVMEHERVQKSNAIKRVVSIAHGHLKQILVICDALGLAALSVSGVMISLMARAEPLWLWGPFFAFLTGAFGSIIRDILSKKERLEEVMGEPYSEVAIVWGLFFSFALIWNAENIRPDLIQNLILFTVFGAFVTRILVHYFKVPNVYFN